MRQLFLLAAILFVVANFMPFVFGVQDGQRNRSDCNDPWTRIELLVPGYRWGCWAGQPLEKAGV